MSEFSAFPGLYFNVFGLNKESKLPNSVQYGNLRSRNKFEIGHFSRSKKQLFKDFSSSKCSENVPKMQQKYL